MYCTSIFKIHNIYDYLIELLASWTPIPKKILQIYVLTEYKQQVMSAK